MPVRPDFYEVPHTADLALSVRGASPADLLLHSAQGMVAMLHCRAAPGATPDRQNIRLDAPDLETLLVDWLNEILYLVSERALYPQEFVIHTLENNSLLATVVGLKPSEGCRYIKAATFHGLVITKQEDYQATIVFDV